ncbi:hypothetical protein SLEP1_g42204 [Rubroshorea leprosula]|uniref:Cytochrome P450 n=1 Tax=Rubroshorea leprosula TaxID=152421 RepID=A0AAV5L963_9ROSI|nr:hypothetical protein SLEP1_g42204 [Rubroshorea leprosula]
MSNFYDGLVVELQSWWWAGIAVVLACYYAWLMTKKSIRTPPLPPGPPGLPLLGNLPFLQPDLNHYLTKLSQTYGPIMRLQLGRKICIVISSPSLAKIILKDNDAIFANHEVFAAARALVYGGIDIIFSPNGPQWRKLRKIFVHQLMSNASLDACYAIRKQGVRELVKDVHGKAGSRIDISQQIFTFALDVTMTMVWGGPLHGEERNSIGPEFIRLVRELVELLSRPNLSDLFPILAPFDLQGIESKVKKVFLWFDQMFESVIAGRTKDSDKRKNKDLLQFLLEMKHQGDEGRTPCLSMDEIKALFMDILLGATETSSTTVEWAMTKMLQHPTKMRRVREEIEEVVGDQKIVEESHLPKLLYLDAVIKETLRLHPTVPFLVPRNPSRDCCIAGYTIPQGSRIMINAWKIQRDPEVWKNPSEFEPERFLKEPRKGDYNGNFFSFLPFGSGRRVCAGLPLAEKMIKYVLATLLHSFEWEIPAEVELDLSEKFGLVMKKRNPLVAIPTPRLATLEQYY